MRFVYPKYYKITISGIIYHQTDKTFRELIKTRLLFHSIARTINNKDNTCSQRVQELVPLIKREEIGVHIVD